MTNQEWRDKLNRKYGPYESDCIERFNCSPEQAAKTEGVEYSWEERQQGPYVGFSDARIKAGIEYIKNKYK